MATSASSEAAELMQHDGLTREGGVEGRAGRRRDGELGGPDSRALQVAALVRGRQPWRGEPPFVAVTSMA